MEKLEIKHFKAFGTLLTISPTATKKNVLLYGENGSGKSSVYEAIRLAFYRDRLLQGVISAGAEAAQVHAETEHYYGTYSHKLAPETAIPDIEIKVNNTDFKAFSSDDYNCFMLSDADLQCVTQEVEGGAITTYCKRDFDFLWFLENQHVISGVFCRGTNEKQNYRKTFLLRFRNAKVLKFPDIHKSLSKKYNSHRKFNTYPVFKITFPSIRLSLNHRQIA